MSVKYSWSRQNGAAVPPVRFMSIEPAEDYYKGMPLKLKEKGIVEPTDGDPEYICMAQYDPDTEIQPLEIPVQEVFPDVVYDRMNEDGTTEEVRFGSKGGGVSEERLTEAINTALAQAKASGEFDGAPGYTPVKGTDYYTAADKAEMVNAVLAALPTWTGGSY